ncbi:MAG: hypothetical protein K0R08_643 [Solimicrobium sp.]|jgi:hypothetical protein|nr:hypothetical protein [Solimicrobium sp.]
MELTKIFSFNPKNTSTANVTGNSTQDRARHLEQENPVLALDYYLFHAENGDSEAQYRYGLMRLEGCGKAPDFAVGIRYLEKAAQNGYVEAETYLVNIKTRTQQLNTIVSSFEELNGKDNPFETDMPVKLQLAILEIIMATKKKDQQEGPTVITHSDVALALNDLVSIPSNSENSCLKALNEYRRLEVQTLLKKGVEQYNLKKNSSILFCQEDTEPLALLNLPDDIWNIIESYTPIVHLGRVSTSYGIRFDYNEHFWKTRLMKIESKPEEEREKKKTFLQKLDLRKGKGTTSENSKKKVAVQYPNLKTDKYTPSYRPEKTQFLLSPDLRNDLCVSLDEKGCRWLKEQKGITDLPLIRRIRNGQRTVAESSNLVSQLQAALESEHKKFLTNLWVRARIFDGALTLKELNSISEGGENALTNLSVQLFLGQEANQSSISMVSRFSREAAQALRNDWIREQITHRRLTFQQLIGINDDVNKALCKSEIQLFLEETTLADFGRVLNFSWQAIKALEEAWIRELISNKKLTLKQIANFSTATSGILRTKKVQNFFQLKGNWQYFDPEKGFCYETAIALENDWVCDQINKKTLEFSQLADISAAKDRAFRNRKIQYFLDQPENLQCISDLTAEVSKALCRPEMQCFLDEEINWPCIREIILVPWSAKALANSWVMARLSDRTLTLQELAKINSWAVQKALCNPKIQEFLMRQDKDRLCSYINQLVGFSDYAAQALQDLSVLAQLTNNTLAFEQLTDINSMEAKTRLCNLKI